MRKKLFLLFFLFQAIINQLNSQADSYIIGGFTLSSMHSRFESQVKDSLAINRFLPGYSFGAGFTSPLNSKYFIRTNLLFLIKGAANYTVNSNDVYLSDDLRIRYIQVPIYFSMKMKSIFRLELGISCGYELRKDINILREHFPIFDLSGNIGTVLDLKSIFIGLDIFHSLRPSLKSPYTTKYERTGYIFGSQFTLAYKF